MEKFNNRTLVRIIIIFLSVLYATFHHLHIIPLGFNEALTICLLILLLEQFLEISHNFHKKETKNDLIEEFIKKNKSVNGQLLNNLTVELEKAIKLEENSFIIDHQIWALYSYVNYWQLLAKDQEKHQRQKSLEVQIIHSCEITIWKDHPLTKQLLQEQRNFCLHGGKITRILCGKGEVPSEDFKTAAEQMLEAGIKVRYFNIRSNMIGHNFAWDFLRIVQNEHSVIWGSFGTEEAGGAITEATYTNVSEYKGQDLKTLWTQIEKHSYEFAKTVSGIDILRPK